MVNNVRNLLGIISVGLLASAQPVYAADGIFIPRANVSFASYNFSQSARPSALAPTGINNNDFPEVKFDVIFKILGVGGTYFKNGYYLDVSMSKSMDAEDDFVFEDPGLPGGVFKETFTGNRTDYALTVGKKILDNRGGIYMGYKAGKSEATGDQGQSLSFEESGIFIGTNYGWKVGSGNFSVNVAYADLKGDMVEEVTNSMFAALPTPLDTDATSDAKGLSYGVSWSSRLSSGNAYSIGLDIKNYTFENIKDKNPNAIPSDKFEEEFISTTFTLFFL